MKKHLYILVLCFLAFLLTHSGCKKDSVEALPTTPPITTPQVNTAPIVLVNHVPLVVLPVNSIVLTGSVKDAENNVKEIQWTKIDGPNAGNILTPNEITTTVSNLVKGTYQFELRATDSKGLTDKKTLWVTVYDPNQPGQGEVLFSGITSQCPMGCWLEISCVSCSIPPNKPYKVYVSEEQSNIWLEAVPESQWTANTKHSYMTDKDKLWIFVPEEPTVFNVKFLY